MPFFKMTSRRWESMRRFFWLAGKVVGLSLVVILSIRFFIVAPGVVNGRSMEPHFNDGDYFFVDKMSYVWRTPRRFEVVQIVDTDENKYLIKRVIGLPGETIVIWKGRVWEQMPGGQLFEIKDEAYVAIPNATFPLRALQDQKYVVTVGSDEYFVLGDNRLHSSSDSRQFGPVARAKIVGRVIKTQ